MKRLFIIALLLLTIGYCLFEFGVFSSDQSTTTSSESEILRLSIPDESMLILNQSKQLAIQKGVLTQEEKNYVEMTAFINGEACVGKIRLKGDWTDHLKSKRPSYRLKLKGKSRFKGCKTFSIQNPRTRKFADEWLIHKLAESEGVLTTFYDFVHVQINGEAAQVYAIEEHFTKELLERQDRKAGPILKLNEDGVWDATLYNTLNEDSLVFPYFECCYVDVFQSSKILDDEVMRADFNKGARLLQLFKEGSDKLEVIFDMDQLAKFYVLNEISGFNHGLRWHNRRFYYNAEKDKLEHILYDVLPFANQEGVFNIESKLWNEKSSLEFGFDNAIFLNEQFQERYFHHLKRMTAPEYLIQFYQEIRLELQQKVALIREDDPGYELDVVKYLKHAQFINSRLEEVKTAWDAQIVDKSSRNDWITSPHYTENLPCLAELSLIVHQHKTNGQWWLDVENYCTETLHLIGYIGENSADTLRFEEDSHILAFSDSTDVKMIRINEPAAQLLFKVQSGTDVRQKDVLNYPHPLRQKVEEIDFMKSKTIQAGIFPENSND